MICLPNSLTTPAKTLKDFRCFFEFHVNLFQVACSKDFQIGAENNESRVLQKLRRFKKGRRIQTRQNSGLCPTKVGFCGLRYEIIYKEVGNNIQLLNIYGLTDD